LVYNYDNHTYGDTNNGDTGSISIIIDIIINIVATLVLIYI